MAQTVKITPALGTLEFIGNTSLAVSTTAIFTGNTAGSINVVFPAAQGISITGTLTVSGSAKFGSILDSANNSGTLNYIIAANGSGGYTWTDLTSILNVSYVPINRTITIDGVSQDLSANRTWNILPSGGATGQILAKSSNTNYAVEWIDNYTSTVKHLVKLGENMTAGTAVYVTGTTGQSGTNMIVSKASNSMESTSSKTLGLLQTGGNTNAIVYVITEGLLAGLNTSTASAGDPVWLGTNGNLIFGLANKPVAPAHLVFIGIVTRVQQNNGEIFVKVQNGFELKEIHDVLINGTSTGQLLRLDSDGLWKNWTPNYLTAEADTLESVTSRGNTTPYAITITNSTQATNLTSGALTVTGGVGIGGNLYVGGNLVIGGTTTTVNAQNLTVSDNMIYLNNGVEATIIGIETDGASITYTTEHDHNYTVGMSVTIIGVDPDVYNFSNQTITAVETNSFTIASTVTDPPYASGGTARAKSNANPDIGFAAGYNDGSYAHTGLFRDASDNVYKFFKGYTPEPDDSPFIDTTHGSFQYASVRADQITGTSFVKVGGTSSQFLKADGSIDSTTYLSSENDPYRVTAVSVSGTTTKTITITRADSTTVSTTWSDYDTNTYVTSAAFNISNGVLTLTRNDAGTVAVDLDGRYSEIGHTHTVSTGTGGYIAVAGGEANIFSIDSRDRRALVDLPNTFDRGLYLDFKNSEIFPQLESSGYRGQMIWRAYGDDGDMSGGYPLQIVYDQAGDIHYRLGVSVSAWADQFSTIASQQWVEGNGYITSESDPTVPSHVKSITTTNISNWNAAYNDKINSAAFNTANGLLTLTQQDGGTVTVNLDGRYLTSYTETDTLDSVAQRGATTNQTLTLAKVITTGLYGHGTSGNIAIWQYDASNTGYGIVYNEGSPDTLRIDVSGNALSGTPDFLVGPDYVQVNGNTVLHSANYSSYSSYPNLYPNNTWVGNAIYFGGGNNYLNWDGARIASNVGIQSSSDMRAPVFYDSADTNYYLDPNGTSILSAATFNSGISDNNSSRIFMPGGASSVNNPSGTAGAIRINLPTAAFGVNTMMSMTVHVYEYSSGQSFTVKLGGYNYFSHDWYNTFAYMINDTGKVLDIPVYFGHDGTRDVIWLGEPDWGWEYPNVFVTEFQTGHTQYSSWRTGWSITFDQTERTNVTQQRVAHRQIDTGNIGSQTVSYSTSSGNSTTTSQTNFSALSVNNNAVWHAGNFTNSSTNWNAAYNDKINSAAFNTGNGLLTLTQQDGGTVTVNLDGRYLTSASDSQTLEWIPETLTLQISNGNQVELAGLATEIWVANQGYITGYSETDTLDSVTDRGATTTNTIRIGKLGIGRGASANESISVENPEGSWLIQGFRNSVSIGGLHTNGGILHLQAQASAEIRFETAGNVTWGGAVIATRNWVGSQGYLTAEADTLASVTARGASTAEAVNFTSTQLTMSPHYYTNMYGETETYVHFYPSGGNGPQISAVNWRVWNGENGAMVLRAAGDGSLTWDGNEIATRSWTQAQGYLTSVSDVWVNTTGDTMTGALTINTTGTGGAASLRVNTSSSATFVHSQENMAANLTSGQHNILVVGKSANTKNSGYIGYYWSADASNSNFVTLGHWGSDDLLRIYGNGETHIYGNTVLLNAGQLYINNSNPTIYLQDSDQRSAMIHVNSGYFYVLNGSGNNSTTWAQQINGRWAMSINLADNYTTFGGVGDFPTEVYAGGSFRAPIFYDSANTNYYLDPNSQSVLYNVQVSNVLRIGPNYHVQQNANGDLEFRYI